MRTKGKNVVSDLLSFTWQQPATTGANRRDATPRDSSLPATIIQIYHVTPSIYTQKLQQNRGVNSWFIIALLLLKILKSFKYQSMICFQEFCLSFNLLQFLGVYHGSYIDLALCIAKLAHAGHSVELAQSVTIFSHSWGSSATSFALLYSPLHSSYY